MEARVVDAETRAEIAEEKVSVSFIFTRSVWPHHHNLDSELHSSPRRMEMRGTERVATTVDRDQLDQVGSRFA
jgi:hypothetical protein